MLLPKWTRRQSSLWLPTQQIGVGPWRFNPCSGCCQQECTACLDQGPSNFQVVIDGIADASCTDCTILNDTYILPFITSGSGTFGDPCIWEYNEGGSSGCDLSFVRLSVFLDGPAGYFITVIMNMSGNIINWKKSYGTGLADRPDCANLTNEDIPLLNNISTCDASAPPTALVTTL